MDNFTEIYKQLTAVPGLCDSIGMEKSMKFILLAASWKDVILALEPPLQEVHEPPVTLPEIIRTRLGTTLQIQDEYIEGCWKAFKNVIWTYNGNTR